MWYETSWNKIIIPRKVNSISLSTHSPLVSGVGIPTLEGSHIMSECKVCRSRYPCDAGFADMTVGQSWSTSDLTKNVVVWISAVLADGQMVTSLQAWLSIDWFTFEHLQLQKQTFIPRNIEGSCRFSPTLRCQVGVRWLTKAAVSCERCYFVAWSSETAPAGLAMVTRLKACVFDAEVPQPSTRINPNLPKYHGRRFALRP